MLSIRNISKSYTQRGLVLDNLSIDVPEGASLAIMGPSGSGKTTLLNIIGLLDKPDSGSIFFKNNEIDRFSDEECASYRNREIGFVFQDHLLLNYLTVAENITLPLVASRSSGSELLSKEERIREIMIKTGIYDLRDKYPFQISGGEAQRVALVRALACKPSMLLADEPTGSLDAKNSGIMGDLLLEMNRDYGVTIILATHSADLAGKMSRILHLAGGKIAKE
jgi:ABC-type lipoprotein export system ATPase subunit